MKILPLTGLAAWWLQAAALSGENLLVNGDFEAGTNGWVKQNFSGASASFDVIDDPDLAGSGSGVITVSAAGTANWHVQLQQNVTQKAGQAYLLEFVAKAAAERPLWLILQKAVGGNTIYLNRQVTLTTSPQKFSFEYTATVDDTVGYRFYLGTNAATVYLDGVVMTTDTAVEEPVETLPDPLPNEDPAGPELDGVVEAQWDAAGVFVTEQQIRVRDTDRWTTIAAEFRTLWTEQAFYVLVEVRDDVLFTEAQRSHDNDMVEFYFDLNNSKSSVYDGVDDDQIRLIPLSRAVVSKKGVTEADLQFGSARTAEGWRIEAKFPWSVLSLEGFVPEAGRLIGFDLFVSDNDQDAVRRGLLGWNATVNNAWFDASLFGVMRLTAHGTTDRETFAIPEIVSDEWPLDESRVARVLHVDGAHPSAVDEGNDGTNQAVPLRTIGRALVVAADSLAAGVGTKIRIAPGTYREGGLKPVRPAQPAGWNVFLNTELVIEGSAPGSVILSGSDVWTGGWQDEGGGRYSRAWPYAMQTYQAWGSSGPSDPITHRREMVFAEGQRLEQVLTVAELAEGRFALDSAGTRIWAHFPAGIDPQVDLVEVAVRGDSTGALGAPPRLLALPREKDKVVLRNLVLQHANLRMDTGALLLAGRKLLLEDVTVRHSNGHGINVAGAMDATLRRVRVEQNGFAGIILYDAERVRLEDCVTSDNNWRGRQGNFFAWSIGGIKTHRTRGLELYRHEASRNWCPGLWTDVGVYQTVYADSVVEENWGPGILAEISEGLVIRGCRLEDNVEGLRIHSAHHGYVDSNDFVNNGIHVTVYRDHRDFTSSEWTSQLGFDWAKDPVQWWFTENRFAAGGDSAWQSRVEAMIPSWLQYASPGYQPFFHLSQAAYGAVFFGSGSIAGNTWTHPRPGGRVFRDAGGAEVTAEVWQEGIASQGNLRQTLLEAVREMARANQAGQFRPDWLIALNLTGVDRDRTLVYRDAIIDRDPADLPDRAALQAVIDLANQNEDLTPNPFRIFPRGQDGARTVSWLGSFWDQTWPFLAHAEHGWCYAASTANGQQLWYNYRDQLGWVYFTQGTYPWLYSFDRGDWLYYFPGDGVVRFFYVAGTGEFLVLPGGS